MAAVKAVLATANAHKAAEFEDLLPGWQIGVLEATYPPEVGETYEDNALAKARFGRSLAPADMWVLGDDSGIEVDALDGGPGVYSARWAPTDQAVRMVAAMDGKADRGARYVCALAAIAPDGRELVVRGTLEGRIADELAGSEGFGYDPAFVPGGETATAAELGNAWKAEHSHRARAAQELLRRLAGATS